MFNRDAFPYWQNELTGQLRPVIETYLHGFHMTARDVAVMRVYLRMWVNYGDWRGPMIDVLRTSVDDITCRADIKQWIERAADAGLDPI